MFLPISTLSTYPLAKLVWLIHTGQLKTPETQRPILLTKQLQIPMWSHLWRGHDLGHVVIGIETATDQIVPLAYESEHTKVPTGTEAVVEGKTFIKTLLDGRQRSVLLAMNGLGLWADHELHGRVSWRVAFHPLHETFHEAEDVVVRNNPEYVQDISTLIRCAFGSDQDAENTQILERITLYIHTLEKHRRDFDAAPLSRCERASIWTNLSGLARLLHARYTSVTEVAANTSTDEVLVALELASMVG